MAVVDLFRAPGFDARDFLLGRPRAVDDKPWQYLGERFWKGDVRYYQPIEDGPITRIEVQVGFGDSSPLSYAITGLDLSIAEIGAMFSSGGGFENRVEDTLFSGNDQITGSSGDDTLAGHGGDDIINGGAGNDVINGGSGDDVLRGNDGADLVYGGDGFNRAEGGDGDDTVSSGEDGVAEGGAGDDTVSGNGVLDGGPGQDRVSGSGTLRGGTGDDVLAGGPFVDGGGGTDTYEVDYWSYFEQQWDVAPTVGGAVFTLQDDAPATLTGIELIRFTRSDDVFELSELLREKTVDTSATGGDDELVGTSAGEEIRALGGNDDVSGRGGADGLWGGRGRDTLEGEAGSDSLFGGKGRDDLYGGVGADTLEGGAGRDRLTGGPGTDDFAFSGRFGRDVIQDFDARSGKEDVDLSEVASIRNWTDLRRNHLEKKGKNAVIDDGDGSVIVLANVNVSLLDKSDFIF